jgi:hypothetical protein
MDLAVLGGKLLTTTVILMAAKFRDIEQRLLTLLQSLTKTQAGWLQYKLFGAPVAHA